MSSQSNEKAQKATTCGCRSHWHDEAVLSLMAQAWNEGWQAGYDDYDQGTETPNPHQAIPTGERACGSCLAAPGSTCEYAPGCASDAVSPPRSQSPQ